MDVSLTAHLLNMREPYVSSRTLAALATVVLSTACNAAPTPDSPAGPVRTRHVLVIGIDGIRPDVLASVPTPNLDALAEAGAFSAEARTGFPTVSGPGWSSFLTGVWPDKHGVTDNTFSGSNYGAFPDFLTRIERAAPELATFAAVDWTPLIDSLEGGRLVGDAVDVTVRLDGYELGWAEADSAVVAASVLHLETADPNAMFVYLGNPDEASHHAESIEEPYRQAIALADRHVGLLMDAVRARPNYSSEDWLVVSSTDHGRLADGGHGGDSPEESTIYFLVSGAGVAPGSLEGAPSIVDVPLTAMAHVGIVADSAWALDGRVVGIDPLR